VGRRQSAGPRDASRRRSRPAQVHAGRPDPQDGPLTPQLPPEADATTGEGPHRRWRRRRPRPLPPLPPAPPPPSGGPPAAVRRGGRRRGAARPRASWRPAGPPARTAQALRQRRCRAPAARPAAPLPGAPRPRPGAKGPGGRGAEGICPGFPSAPRDPRACRGPGGAPGAGFAAVKHGSMEGAGAGSASLGWRGDRGRATAARARPGLPRAPQDKGRPPRPARTPCSRPRPPLWWHLIPGRVGPGDGLRTPAPPVRAALWPAHTRAGGPEARGPGPSAGAETAAGRQRPRGGGRRTRRRPAYHPCCGPAEPLLFPISYSPKAAPHDPEGRSAPAWPARGPTTCRSTRRTGLLALRAPSRLAARGLRAAEAGDDAWQAALQACTAAPGPAVQPTRPQEAASGGGGRGQGARPQHRRRRRACAARTTARAPDAAPRRGLSA
jgi:hypothetical protein